jgi:hypothetical protein
LPTWIASAIRELKEGLEVGFLYIVIDDYSLLASLDPMHEEPLLEAQIEQAEEANPEPE